MGRVETAIGVDVGGTRIRIARISRSGDMLDRVIEPIRQDRKEFEEQLLRLVGTMRTANDSAIGIGVPGRVDGRTGEIRSAGYLDIAGLDLAGLITAEFGLSCHVENDATMALLAEADVRAEGGHGLIFMVTVGTGIGGAALENGRPWYGGGLSGQFGHIVVAQDGPPCNCGRIGCVETFSSGTALGRLIDGTTFPRDIRAENLLARAEANDETAAELLACWAGPLKRAIESLVAVADPRLVLIGGGLGAEMFRAIQRLPRQDKWFSLPIEAASLGDGAGVIGAGLRAFQPPRVPRREVAG